jgi:hypothetical protein
VSDAASSAGLTPQEGRALQERARRFQTGEKVGLVVSAIGMIVFIVSIYELRGIEASVAGGGTATVPYFAYAGIALFWGGFGLLWWMRSRVLRIYKVLSDEQARRDALAIEAEIARADAELAAAAPEGGMAQEGVPAAAGADDDKE